MKKSVKRNFNTISKVKLGDPILKVIVNLENNHLNLSNTIKIEAK